MPNVLIVDDTAVDRRLAGGLLEQAPDMDVCYAEHGRAALQMISQYLPDLVVTDLQMPEMDGLALVEEISARYPDLPVVLMTAHGSENIAAQALANGAASYVPKTELAVALVDTVQHVLAFAAAESRHKKLARCTLKAHIDFELDNDPTLFPPILELVQQWLSERPGVEHAQRVRWGVALEEALTNALVRGNLELSRAEIPVCTPAAVATRASQAPYSERRVRVSLTVNQNSFEFVIRNEGPPFAWQKAWERAAQGVGEDDVGRGLILIREFISEVAFADEGRQITLRQSWTA